MLLPDDPLVDAAESRPREGSRRGLLRGMGWATLDQAVSSCTNFGVAVVAARQLSRNGFGAFGLAISLSVIVVGVTRSLATEPLLSRPELAAGPRRKATFGAAAGAEMSLGLVASVGVAASGVLLGGELGRALLALSIALPGLCLQDAWRFCFLSQGRGDTAALNDGAWLLAQVLALAGLAASGRWSATTVILAWSGAGAVAALVGLVQARLVPRPFAGWSWLGSQGDLGGRYCLEFVVANGGTQLALVGLGGIAGLSAVGAVRGAQTFFGPLVVLFGGILLALVPAATTFQYSPARLRRLACLISAAVAACAFGWTLFGLALPASLGEGLFGDSWGPTRRVLLPYGLILIASGAASGPYAGLRALAAAREGLRARVLTLPIIVGAPLLGAVAADAAGFSYGLAGGTLAMAAIYWHQFTLANARSQPAPRAQLADDPTTY